MNDLFDSQSRAASGPVECLGQTFPSDAARREHFLGLLWEKLRDPEFRKVEGFPIGRDEDILAMSDPPYYTACPNPFLDDFVRHYGKPFDPAVPYRREPQTLDVSVGKTDPLYKAHSYHTKVPHLAIVPAILHYTEPGDLVLDGFAGSGMTGVAAQWCGAAPPAYRAEIEAEWRRRSPLAGDGGSGASPASGLPRWGARRVILNDLSPAATFIAANYNLPC
ncbi:MAG: DNA methylase, partial [Chromatiaceae bacterium]|nr:DNA methylase [Chromatiaceae bacterium]